MGVYSRIIRGGFGFGGFLVGMAVWLMITAVSPASADDSVYLEGLDLLGRTVAVSDDLAGNRLTTRYLKNRFMDNYEWAQPEGDAPRGIYFTPYYAVLDKSTEPIGYDADVFGFMTGYDHQTNNLLYGAYLGYSKTDVDFTGAGNSGNGGKQSLLSAGLNVMGERDDLTWRSQVTGFLGWHDYDGLTGVNLAQAEHAGYNSYGASANLMLGRLLRTCCGDVMLPEVGLDYIWWHRDAFTSSADDAAWNVENADLDKHQVRAVASLRILTSLDFRGIELTPTLTVGVRYLLNNEQLEVNQSVGGALPVLVQTKVDKLAGTLTAALMAGRGNLFTELGYSGEYGDKTTLNNVWLRVNYRF